MLRVYGPDQMVFARCAGGWLAKRLHRAPQIFAGPKGDWAGIALNEDQQGSDKGSSLTSGGKCRRVLFLKLYPDK